MNPWGTRQGSTDLMIGVNTDGLTILAISSLSALSSIPDRNSAFVIVFNLNSSNIAFILANCSSVLSLIKLEKLNSSKTAISRKFWFQKKYFEAGPELRSLFKSDSMLMNLFSKFSIIAFLSASTSSALPWTWPSNVSVMPSTWSVTSPKSRLFIG